MKKLILIPVICAMFACTATKPQTAAPTYNITITDNSQTITGDNNKSDSRNDAKTEQISKPTASTKVDETHTNNMWIFWTIVLLAGAGAGYYFLKKYKVLR